jgi:hypothetical protein
VQSPSEDVLNFLENISWPGKEINIRAYTTAVDIKNTMNAFETRGLVIPTIKNPNKSTLLLFTNVGRILL